MSDRLGGARDVIKVSIVIASYRSVDCIERVLASIRAQTMSHSEVEVIIVDDGSPDGTWPLLQRLARADSGLRVEQIEHSGWPSKPRNLGLSMARGEYVLFMDHDDELAPDALRAAWELGHRNGADAVNGKETRTVLQGWAIQTFTEDMDNGIGRIEPNALMPMNPHKLYRRAFLNEHGIRFPEGGRTMWEDIFFNIEVLRHAEVISVLSQTAFYHWVRTGVNTSSTYGLESEEFWDQLERIFAFIVEHLAGSEHERDRDALIFHHYRARVLRPFSVGFERRSAEAVQRAVTRATQIMQRYVPVAMDEQLDSTRHAIAVLLRAGRADLLGALVAVDRSMVGTAEAASVAWQDGSLVVTAAASWKTADPDGVALTRDAAGGIARLLPDAVRAALPDALIDVTAEVEAASGRLSVRNYNDMSVWMLPTDERVELTDESGRVRVRVQSRCVVDIDDAIFGKPLEDASWLFGCRATLMSALNQRGVRSSVPVVAALVNGRAAVAYSDTSGLLRLDVGQRRRSIVGSSTPRLNEATVTRVGRSFDFRIRLDGVEVFGDTSIAGRAWLAGSGRLSVFLGRVRTSGRVARMPFGTLLRRIAAVPLARRHPVRLVGDAEGAWLEGRLAGALSNGRLVLEFGDRVVASEIAVRRVPGAQPEFVRAPFKHG